MTGIEILAVVAAVATVASVATSIAGASQQASAAQYEADVQQQQAEVQAQSFERQRQFAERDAQVYEQEAAAVEDRAEVQEAQFRKDVARLRARQIATATGSGLTLAGSPLTIIGADAADAEFEVQLLHYDAKRDAHRLRSQASITRDEGQTLQWNADVARSSKSTFAQAGDMRARSSMLAGYGSAAGAVGSFAGSSAAGSMFDGGRSIPRTSSFGAGTGVRGGTRS